MMKPVMKQIFDKIQDAETIMLFRHRRIDGDCLGATKGMKGLIQCTWPEKKVYLIDDEKSEYLPLDELAEIGGEE